MKKFFRKRWVRNVGLVLAAVALCACFFKLTDGFENWNPKDIATLDLNEDNLFFEKIEDGEIYDNLQVEAKAENGVITLDGEIADSSATTIDLSDSIDLGTITLQPGTYTFTCLKNPAYKSHYAVGTYTISGVTYTWYADFENAPNNAAGAANMLGRTITLDESVTVNFEIRLVEGAKLNNVKAMPVIVEGEEPGDFYANGLFG